MNPTLEQSAPSSSVPLQRGLAIASLILGILAICLSFLLFGFLLGVIGLILGVVHLCQKRGSNTMARWGIVLSVLGLLASLAFGMLYFQAFKRLRTTWESANKSITEWEGATAPDFTFTTLDGKKTSLSELKGKRVILDFWATWCPPCKKEIPHFIRLVSDTSRDDLIVIGISSEDEKTLHSFVKQNGLNYPVASADKLPEPFASIESIPTTFFIDRRGIIQNVLVGYEDFTTLKTHASQKDFEGSPKPAPIPASVLNESVQPLLDAALSGTNAIGDEAIRSLPQRLLAFNKRTLTEAYKQVGVRDPKWDDLVISYLDDFAQYFADAQKALPAETLCKNGKQIANTGCKDPLFLYCYGVAQDSCHDATGAETSLAEAAAGLLQSKYPAVRQRYAATRMAYLSRNHGFNRQSEYETWRTKAIALIVKSLQDGSYQDGEQRVFIMQFDPDWDDLFLDKREEVYQAIKAAKAIDPWVLKIVDGDYWIYRAWKARGSGWANTVTEAGWKGFFDGLARARTSLVSAWKMRPDYPEAAAKMIKVTMGEGSRQKEPPRVWFGRAIQGQADYLPAYAEYEYQMLPRWGGSHEAMLNFGLECLATKRFDTAIPYRYYVMLHKVISDLDSPGTALWDDPSVYNNLQVLCEGYINSNKPPQKKSAYQSLWAAICWRTGHYDRARQILDELGDKTEGSIFIRDFKTPFDIARTEIYALTSPFTEDLKAARALAASNFQVKAINGFQEVIERANGDSNVISYARQNMDTLRTMIKISQGDWVPLTIPRELTGWTVRAGDWRVEDDGAVVGDSKREGLLLVCNQLFDQNLEVKGELEFVQAPYKYNINGGIAVGATDKKPDDLYSCLLYQAEREASVGAGRGFRGSGRVKKPANVETKNSFLMRVRDKRFTLIVNGALVLEETSMDRYEADEQQRFGIGSYCWYPGVTLRFRNIQVRSLKD